MRDTEGRWVDAVDGIEADTGAREPVGRDGAHCACARIGASSFRRTVVSQPFLNSFSTLPHLFLNSFSTVPQLFLSSFSTVPRLFLNSSSTLSQLFLRQRHPRAFEWDHGSSVRPPEERLPDRPRACLRRQPDGTGRDRGRRLAMGSRVIPTPLRIFHQ